MDFQSQAVADPVEESAPAAVPDFRGVTPRAEPVTKVLLGSPAVEARADLAKNAFLSLNDGGVEVVEGFGGASFHHGTGDIPEIPGTGITGKDVEDNGLMGAQRA